MRRLAATLLAGLLLAGCDACQPPATVNAGVGVGTGGVSGALALGQSCGPALVSVGFGNGWFLGW